MAALFKRLSMPSGWMNAPWPAFRDRAGKHCQKVHQDVIETANLDLVHVQADEIRVKGAQMIPWMGLALMISARLWVAGAVHLSRDRALADALMQQVRRCCQLMKALLVCTDGWNASPNSIRRAFREKIKQTPGRGRASLRIWSELHIGTVIKRTEKRRVVEVTRRMSHGNEEQAMELLERSEGGVGRCSTRRSSSGLTERCENGWQP